MDEGRYGPLHEGRASWSVGGRHGWVDAERRVVIPPTYEEAANFCGGRAIAKRGGLYGFVDPDGREVIAVQYRNASPFASGRAFVRTVDGDFQLIDQDGATVVRVDLGITDSIFYIAADRIRVAQGAKVGFLDLEGRMVVPCVYDEADFGFAWGRARVRRGDLWGYVDLEGREAVPCRYPWTENFLPSGYARVLRDRGYGLVDLEGKEVVACRYHDVGRVSEGRVRVAHAPERSVDEWYGRTGYVDLEGNEVVPCVYEDGTDFASGRAVVTSKEPDGSTHRRTIDLHGQTIDEAP